MLKQIILWITCVMYVASDSRWTRSELEYVQEHVSATQRINQDVKQDWTKEYQKQLDNGQTPTAIFSAKMAQLQQNTSRLTKLLQPIFQPKVVNSTCPHNHTVTTVIKTSSI